MEIATLSPLEQKIYFAARNAKEGVILLELMYSWNLTDRKTLLVALSSMVKKGWMTRLRKGVYLVGEPGFGTLLSPFVTATYIFPGYIAFSSALYAHKLIDNVPFEVQVATRNERGIKQMGQYSFRAIPIGKKHIGSEKKDGYTISTIPKTIYDCLVQSELAGGYPQILKAISEARLSESEWKEVMRYAKRFEKSAFFQRLGYILGIMPKKNKAIQRLIAECKKKVRSKIYLYKRRNGRYVRQWKLVDDIGKEELLSWWY